MTTSPQEPRALRQLKDYQLIDEQPQIKPNLQKLVIVTALLAKDLHKPIGRHPKPSSYPVRQRIGLVLPFGVYQSAITRRGRCPANERT